MSSRLHVACAQGKGRFFSPGLKKRTCPGKGGQLVTSKGGGAALPASPALPGAIRGEPPRRQAGALQLRMERPGEGAGGAARRGSPGMAGLQAAKRALRAELKRRLKALPDPEKRRQSRLLGAKVMGHSKYQASQRIAVFLSMPDEVQTEEIIKDIFQRGKECFIPQYKSQSNHMDMVRLASYEEIALLPLTSWNIHQPPESDKREEALSVAEGLDLILMPGLGFDRTGNRLGRGKGYYDTYLEKCMHHPKGKPYTIALAFKEQVCDMVPVTENDMKVDEILFEGNGC